MYVYTQKCYSMKVSSFFPFSVEQAEKNGELAQLARASALQAEGQGFKSLILQKRETEISFKRSSLK